MTSDASGDDRTSRLVLERGSTRTRRTEQSTEKCPACTNEEKTGGGVGGAGDGAGVAIVGAAEGTSVGNCRRIT